MSTGSELVQPDEKLGSGQIYDSNSFALTAAARDAGAIAYRVGAVADDAETLRATIEDQLIRADLMVTTGGVSVGAYDVVKEALSSVGDEDEAGSGIEFRKLAMQPGKPQGFGSIGPDHTPLLALPGQPRVVVRLLRAVRPPRDPHPDGPGRRPPAHDQRGPPPDKALTSPAGRRQFLRGRYADGDSHPGRRRRIPPGRRPRARGRADRRPGGPASPWSPAPRWKWSSSAEAPRLGGTVSRTTGPDRERPSHMSTQDRLTHIDEAGAARMVDVSEKDVTARTARASGRVLVSPRVIELLRGEGVPKGDALATARIAGIMGAKRTPDLIPLCHPLSVSGVKLDLSVADDAVEILATVKTTDRTGVEMEALTAVSVAALTVIDMVKAVDKGAVITDVRVEEKTGGKSGDWSRA